MQAAAASESDYYHRLGLASDPFAAEAMPEFFFVGAQRRFLVQRAVHALYFSGANVLLLGPNGSGKTRTLIEIEKDLADLADICRIDATVLMDAAEIRALLATALGLPGNATAGNAELVYALERMRPADRDPQPVLIAIDAAQFLSIETLAESAALVAGAGGRLRLLLSGEADLLTGWQHAQAGAAEILELKPLDRNESEDYVRTKIQAAGCREEHLLSALKFDELFAQSNGNFAAINALVPQLLQPQPEPSSVARRVRAMPMLHIGVAAVLLAVVIVFMFYRDGDSESAQKIESAQPKDIAQPRSKEKNGVEKNTVALQLPSSISPATNESETAVATIVSPSAMSPVSNVTTQASVETSSPTPAPIENKPAEKSVTEVKPATAKKEAPTKKIVAEKTSVASESSTLGADEQALLALPSSQYVLQLMGAESKTTVDKFAKGAGKAVKLYVYRTQLRGKPWFIVVTGPYADKNAVQAGLAKLPEAVRKQQPWARTLVNVQADIRAHSGR